MASYTKETLDKLKKRIIINIVLLLPVKLEIANREVFEEVCKLDDKFSKLESEWKVLKQVNFVLQERAIDLQNLFWDYYQYSRKELV